MTWIFSEAALIELWNSVPLLSAVIVLGLW